MAVDLNTWFARYQPVRRRAEVAFWVVILILQGTFNCLVTLMEVRSMGRGVALWEPVVWEVTSVLVIGALIPAIAVFERRVPLRLELLVRNLPWHLAASVVFCIVHVLAVLVLRRAVYVALGSSYMFSDWGTQLVYEYLKDVRTYAMILLAILSYRFLMLRLQGEARVLDAPESAPPSPHPSNGTGVPPAPATPRPERPERFLVRKLRREFLIAASDIEWLQAQGNYVGLHVRGHDYLLRSTLADFLEQLDPARFVRVHRSYAVNLDQIAEIEPLEAGDARLRMRDGSQVPCSRRYRDGLAPR